MKNNRIEDLQIFTVFNNLAEPIIIAQIDTTVTFLNSPAERLTGWHLNETAEMKLTEVFRIEEKETVNVSSLHGSMREQRILIHRKGARIPIEYSVSLIHSPAGEIVGYLVLFRDITPQVELENALNTSRKRYKHLVHSIDGIVWEARASDHKFIFVSPQAERLLGYPLEHWTDGNGFQHELILAEDRERTLLQCKQSLAERESYLVEFRARTKDGRVVWIQDSASISKDDSEPKLRGIMLDITRQKKNEEELLKAHGELERRVQDREVALGALEEQFRQSQKMEAVGQLAGGVAHDFNNILMGISAYCELMSLSLTVTDPFSQYVAEIQRAVEQGAALTRQLLAFGRKQVLQPRIISLNEILSNMHGMLRRVLRENIELVTELNPETGMIKADPRQIEQVIVNLVLNARDATPAGGTISIGVRQLSLETGFGELSPGQYVLLSVSDTGYGMDGATQSRIFEPFFTTKEQGKGTGLGLSTVYGIVKQSGGHISVYSEVGQGTTFKIYLPCVSETSVEPEPVSQRVPSAPGAETVLVVDDNESVRIPLAAVLETVGYTVLKACHGEDALLIARGFAGKIHVLVTDVVMPQMNGFQLAEQIRKLNPEIRILLMSGHTEETIKKQGVFGPGMAFLSKPVSMEDIKQQIRLLLE